jgi:hypothetical protein
MSTEPKLKTFQVRSEAIILSYTLSVKAKVLGERLVGYKLREIAVECKFSQELRIEVLEQVLPVAQIKAVLVSEGRLEQRERKLNMVVTVLMLIIMHLYNHLSQGEAMRKASKGLRYVWPDPDYEMAGASALSYRRYQLGAKPLVALFKQVCQPLATADTPGAYLFGLRLMAIDGTVEDVADTPANAAVFGRHHGARGDSAFPQIQGVYLVECGTHAVVDAGFWPCQVSERHGGFRLLRSVGPGMLLMWDRGFHDFDMVAQAHATGAELLVRVPSHLILKPVHSYADGSFAAYLTPSDYQRRKGGTRLLVRVIQYTIKDPALPGHGQTHRLITTLLDAARCPAHDLACAYHERWEIELVIDEIDTHQRLAGRPLRSLKPVGVIQELYALLIAHYAIRFLMHQAALHHQLDPDRVSFVHALEILRDAIAEFQMTARHLLDDLFRRLCRDLVRRPLPERRNRTNPRVVKRKMSNFRLKRPEHTHWPQPTIPFREAVFLI